MSIMLLQCRECERRVHPSMIRMATRQCLLCWLESKKADEQLKNQQAEEMVR